MKLSVPPNKEVCNFSHLAYASQTVVNAVKNATEEQIRDENWLKNYWALGGKEIAVGNMDFWYNAWKFLHRPGMIWKKARISQDTIRIVSSFP